VHGRVANNARARVAERRVVFHLDEVVVTYNVAKQASDRLCSPTSAVTSPAVCLNSRPIQMFCRILYTVCRNETSNKSAISTKKIISNSRLTWSITDYYFYNLKLGPCTRVFQKMKDAKILAELRQK